MMYEYFFDKVIFKKIPKITSAVLRFRLKHNDMKYLIAALAALELITSQKGVLIKSKVPNVTLKLRKGQPIGCKVTIRKNTLFSFIKQSESFAKSSRLVLLD